MSSHKDCGGYGFELFYDDPGHRWSISIVFEYPSALRMYRMNKRNTKFSFPKL